ncbi:triple tyrosine motif-containing protein [Sphingobium rhizovicinum]|uniref:Triple tyrosine motif-containing protein n=1 Tax=Sphingobium rhizovicinum TaxID=432308 RepID=A0ABV7NHK6_9SPHN
MKHRAILLALMAALLPAPGLHAGPTLALDQMRHTRWTLKDGAPGNVRALAQGRDGFLWLGASTGLYRFDGVRFDRILPDRDDPRRSLQVTALLTARNGDIWVGYDFGGIAVYRGGHLRDANPWPAQGGVSAIVQARDGSIWVAAESRGKMLLSRFQNGRWTRYGAAQGLVDGMMGPMLAASDGSLYVALPPALLRLKPGAARFDRLPDRVAPFAALAQDGRGQVWIADNKGVRATGQGEAKTALAPVNTPYVTRHLTIDRDHAFWITGQNTGLARLRPQGGGPETAGTGDRQPAPLSLSALEDREANIWIGTETGLDRYAATRLVHANGTESLVTGFVAPPGGTSLFIAGLAGVYRTSPNAAAPRLIFPKSDIGVLCGDARQLLAISLDGAFLLDLDASGDVHRTTPVKGPLSVSCARDAKGQFWTGMDRLYRLEGDRLVPASGAAGQAGGTITLLRSDGAGGLIAARSRHGLLRIRSDGVETPLFPGPPPAIGAVVTMARDGDRLLLGGQKGLALVRSGRMALLTERAYPYLAGLTGIHRTADGWTWLSGATGIVRIRSDALDRAFAHPGRAIAYQRIGHDADYRARSNLFDANDLAQDATGRLWFATDQGLVRADPDRLARNAMPPPVVIRALRVDGREYPIEGGRIALPALSKRVQIDYTALSLTDARENRFRYRLKGAQGDWFDAGTDRQALYTNLSPGDYQFRVVAANNDGVWNEEGATLSFTIAPAFYQTGWFLLLCCAAVGGVGWLLYRRRLHVLTDRARGRVQAQLAERERIARELHDTLLQGFQGLMLRFQAVVEQLPRGTGARKELEGALDRAEDVLIESRERVHSLRQELQPVLLADRLRTLLADMLGDRLSWRIDLDGAPRPICAPVADEMARIVREALSNALRHAAAGTIILRLGHAPDRVVMSVIDDGVGLPAAVAETGMRDGHYGLVGMRERARRLNGSLDILSAPQGGTEIRVSVPARIAYP